MRPVPAGPLFAAAWATFALAMGCPTADSPEERERIAALADVASRQLVAALNAKSREALVRLLVVTSTSGGPPRSLHQDEVERIVRPDPPFELLGAGRPGTMLLRDGRNVKRSVRLVVIGREVKALATIESLSAYLAREAGGEGGPLVDASVRVVSFLAPEP